MMLRKLMTLGLVLFGANAALAAETHVCKITADDAHLTLPRYSKEVTRAYRNTEDSVTVTYRGNSVDESYCLVMARELSQINNDALNVKAKIITVNEVVINERKRH